MLKTLRFLTLPVLVLGGLYVVFSVFMYFVTLNAAREGQLDIETVAVATSNALKGIALGVLVLIVAFVARAVIIARIKKAS
jgi:hypothetical protein